MMQQVHYCSPADLYRVGDEAGLLPAAALLLCSGTAMHGSSG
jgi:hypothetical protein